MMTGASAQQALEDANALIVKMALSLSLEYDYVSVVGEDIDILVLVTALVLKNVNFCKSSRNKYLC